MALITIRNRHVLAQSEEALKPAYDARVVLDGFVVKPWLFAVLDKVPAEVQLQLYEVLSTHLDIAAVSQEILQPIFLNLQGLLETAINDGIEPYNTDTADDDSSESLLGGRQALCGRSWCGLLDCCWLRRRG